MTDEEKLRARVAELEDRVARDRGYDRRGPHVGVVWGDRNGFPCTCEWSSAAHGDTCPEHGAAGVVIPDRVAMLAARVAELEAELEGFRKANVLLSEGMKSVCEGRDELKHRVRELEAELARYSMDAGHADQCRNVARAAVEALGMDWEETSPNDVTAAIKRLRATPVVGCSGCGGLGVFAGVECRWCAGTGRECS